MNRSKCWAKLKIIDKLVIYKLLAGNISSGSVFFSLSYSPLFQLHGEVSREGQRPKVTFIERRTFFSSWNRLSLFYRFPFILFIIFF